MLIDRSFENQHHAERATARPGIFAKGYAGSKTGAIALIICTIALVLNVISLALVMPAVLEASQTGNLTTLFGGGAVNTAGTATSTWG